MNQEPYISPIGHFQMLQTNSKCEPKSLKRLVDLSVEFQQTILSPNGDSSAICVSMTPFSIATLSLTLFVPSDGERLNSLSLHSCSSAVSDFYSMTSRERVYF